MGIKNILVNQDLGFCIAGPAISSGLQALPIRDRARNVQPGQAEALSEYSIKPTGTLNSKNMSTLSCQEELFLT